MLFGLDICRLIFENVGNTHAKVATFSEFKAIKPCSRIHKAFSDEKIC